MKNKTIKIRIAIFSTLLIVIMGIMINCIYGQVNKINDLSDNYKNKLIRFHVLANSDSDEDQNLKLKVRDELIQYLQPKLQNSKTVKESENIILKEKNNLIDICEKVIKDNGYKYTVDVELGYSKFPTKQYSSVVLPAGEYKSLKVLIGEAKGKNWWCVMFPPLCFVDEKNNVIDEKTDKKLKEILTKEEYKLIIEKDNVKVSQLEIKFKIAEIIQKIIN